MTDIQKDLERQSLIEIVKRVQIEDGDILIVRYDDPEIIEMFIDMVEEMHSGENKQIIVIHQDQLDILKEADEDMMRELGWVRAVPNTLSPQTKAKLDNQDCE